MATYFQGGRFTTKPKLPPINTTTTSQNDANHNTATVRAPAVAVRPAPSDTTRSSEQAMDDVPNTQADALDASASTTTSQTSLSAADAANDERVSDSRLSAAGLTGVIPPETTEATSLVSVEKDSREISATCDSDDSVSQLLDSNTNNTNSRAAAVDMLDSNDNPWAPSPNSAEPRSESGYDVILGVSQPGAETSNDTNVLLLCDHDDAVSDVSRIDNNSNDVRMTLRQRIQELQARLGSISQRMERAHVSQGLCSRRYVRTYLRF